VPVSNDKSLVDPLTGLWNGAYFGVQLKEQYVLTTLASQTMACVLTEIDQLGTINVRYGTTIANQVIRKVASVLSSNGGMYATTCSLANHRFATLLRQNDRFQAFRQAEKLRRSLQQILILDGGVQLSVTCSFGVCDSLIASAMSLLDRTEQVLDRAVNRGGNCVAVARAPSKARV
jgi:diguanylate cyclase (GGDEF)-like protein